MKPSATCAPIADSGKVASAAFSSKQGPTSIVVTRMDFAATPEQMWRGLIFYEQIDTPPLLLRLLLPLPIRVDGSKAAVGDEATCLYEGGYLRKRVTHVDPGRYYGFEIVEQNLLIGGGLMLSGGSYTLHELAGRRTEVAVTTRYVSCNRPAWLWKPIEATVCHLFHRHLLSAMRRASELG